MTFEPENFVDKRPNTLFFKHILRKIFLEDWVMKLVALGITLALWLGVTGLSRPGSERFTVPLNVRTAENIIITNSPVEEVEIRVSGDDRRIEQIRASDLRVSVNLSDVAAGERVITLAPDTVSIQLPLGIRLDEIRPGKIAVKLEAVEEKEVAIGVETSGDVPEGFEIYSKTATPQKIRVRGPAGFLKQLSNLSTETIDLDGRTTDFIARQVPITIPNPQTTATETAVDVAFRIGEKRIERIFLVPVSGESGKRATVVLYGPQSLFDGIGSSDMQVQIADGITEPRLILPAILDGRVEIRRLKLS